MTVSTQLLLMDKINFHPTILGPSITSTFKGLTRIRPLSCGFDSSVGRALHWHRRGRGFESRSEPEFFSGLCSSSVTAALALMTVSFLNGLKFLVPSGGLLSRVNNESHFIDKTSLFPLLVLVVLVLYFILDFT